MKRYLAAALTAVLFSALTLTPASAYPEGGPPGLIRSGKCADHLDDALALSLEVEGEKASGRFALPDSAPKGLVVFAHGYGHTSVSWIEHMKKAAREHGLIAVAMDYRGTFEQTLDDGSKLIRGWAVSNGAEDSIAAAQYFERNCPSIETISILGVSMGGNTSGLAVAAKAKRSDGSPLWDYWLDIEGAVNVIETYAGARSLAPVNGFARNAQQDIEREMGGPIESNPAPYRERAVVTRIADIKASGVKGVLMVHGLDDGLVPYNQSRELAAGLLAAGIPAEMFTVGRREKDPESDTTATGYAGEPLFKGAGQDYQSPLSGHASEKSQTHVVMTTAFDQLWRVMDSGFEGSYREFFVDGEAGVFPTP